MPFKSAGSPGLPRNGPFVGNLLKGNIVAAAVSGEMTDYQFVPGTTLKNFSGSFSASQGQGIQLGNYVLEVSGDCVGILVHDRDLSGLYYFSGDRSAP